MGGNYGGDSQIFEKLLVIIDAKQCVFKFLKSAPAPHMPHSGLVHCLPAPHIIRVCGEKKL